MASEIGRRFRPIRVVLFGSHAYGIPTSDSDVDFLVVVERRVSPDVVRCALPDEVAIDVLVRTQHEVERAVALGDPFLGEIMKKGKVVYEASRRRVG